MNSTALGKATISFIVFGGLHLASFDANAANVSAGNDNWPPGPVVIPVALTSGVGEDVASLQLDVLFDSNLFQLDSVTAGSAATSAGKAVSWSVVSPGRARVIVAGFNQTAIPDGVIANLNFTIIGIFPGSHAVTPADEVLSDPDGLSVSSTTTPGAITIDVSTLPSATRFGIVALAGILSWHVARRISANRQQVC